MKHYLKKVTGWAITFIFVLASTLAVYVKDTSAASNGLTMSPMNQSIVMLPGETYNATFRISNSVNSSDNTYYELDVDTFYLNDRSEAVFGTTGDRNKMVDWISFISPTKGILKPNDVKEVEFSITVPEDAPAGGQYASVVAIMKSSEDDSEEIAAGSNGEPQAAIKEIQRIGHLVYAEIAGNTVRDGEIVEIDVPSFLLSGNIKGASQIKNSGNVHGNATYKLQVYPLFSDEEIYTNEENVDKQIIFPDRTVYHETEWAETPSIGIFNVVYSVEFEGATAQVSKMVIICPIWLLFIIFFVVATIIIWIVMRIRARNKSDNARRKAEMEK